MKNETIAWGAIILVVLIFIFVALPNKGSGEEIQSEVASEWTSLELSNVATGENFKISEFSDKPVLLESFAVWCPTCTRQQKIIKDLHEELGDDIISISVDMDPNEDEKRVREHIEKNGFDWYYVVAPVEFTQSLINQFGIDIVNAPSVPMVLICDGKNVRQLGSGIKSVDELKEEISNGC